MKTINKLVAVLFLFTIFLAHAAPPIPGGTGNGGNGTGAPASPIDMYVYVLVIVAIGLIAYFTKKYKNVKA
ncbi:signal peptidase [Chryseobacterium sp. MEBOG06]|uniref:signal peptidase n=1 Tax=Chryseobacterium sp. MEBOG06 TaxID=2879938 RepID=UPI001F25F1B5|nr:signal peptidase [Chryseobacterium sp. MEBOG06]UKB84590.1 signal peptidase [Chryseobacterium sp. MEBOG06]